MKISKGRWRGTFPSMNTSPKLHDRNTSL